MLKKLLENPLLWAALTWPPALIAAGLMFHHFPIWVWAVWGMLLPLMLRSPKKHESKRTCVSPMAIRNPIKPKKFKF